MLTLVLMPRVGQSQGSQSKQDKKPVATMGQNYPNPYNPESRIDFELGGYPTCEDANKLYRVNLKVINILAQVVAVPQLYSSSSGVAGGQKIQNVRLPCGKYTALWDGKYSSGRQAASGMYIWSLEIDGVRVKDIRSTVAK
jgi:hypothetical protein